MKSEIIQDQPEDAAIKYPCLMQSGGDCVVLFSARKHGTVLKGNEHYSVGHYSDAWHMPAFEVFKGKLVLSND